MSHPLDTLWQTIVSRRDGDPEQSYTARLLAGPLGRVAQKVGEEAVETAIEATRLESAPGGDSGKLASESADLLYHLFVLWAAAGLTPEDVYTILDQRQGLGGLAEKRNRELASPEAT